MNTMRHLYGMPKRASEQRASFFRKLAAFIHKQRKAAVYTKKM